MNHLPVRFDLDLARLGSPPWSMPPLTDAEIIAALRLALMEAVAELEIARPAIDPAIPASFRRVLEETRRTA